MGRGACNQPLDQALHCCAVVACAGRAAAGFVCCTCRLERFVEVPGGIEQPRKGKAEVGLLGGGSAGLAERRPDARRQRLIEFRRVRDRG